jgi:hypothetical protein
MNSFWNVAKYFVAGGLIFFGFWIFYVVFRSRHAAKGHLNGNKQLRSPKFSWGVSVLLLALSIALILFLLWASNR